MYKSWLKRMIDCTLALLAIMALSWLLVLLAILVKCTSKGPILFVQKRVGKNRRYFSILKYRTMRIDTPKDCPTHLLKHPEQYITPVGRFLRKTSLDELPQLLNILAGHMAIVGPRPALWNQYDLISLRDMNGANAIRPGLTGWAQINGRDELSIEEKAKFDGEYVVKMSFWFDVRCCIGTVIQVVRQKGVVEGTSADKELVHK